MFSVGCRWLTSSLHFALHMFSLHISLYVVCFWHAYFFFCGIALPPVWLSCSHAFLLEAASSFPTALSSLAPCTAQTHSPPAFLLTCKVPTWGALCAALPSHRARGRKQQGLFPRGGTGCLPPPCGSSDLKLGGGSSLFLSMLLEFGVVAGVWGIVLGGAGKLLDFVPDSSQEMNLGPSG